MNIQEKTPASAQELGKLIHQIANREAEVIDLISALAPVVSGTTPLANEQVLEMSLALNAIEHRAQQEDQLHAMVNEQSSPALLLSSAGTIMALNEPAWQLLGAMTGDSYERLQMSDDEFSAFRQRLMENAATTLVKVQSQTGQPMLMLASYHHSHQVFLLSALQHNWPASLDKALEDIFDLTATERDVLSLLAQGLIADQIAERRSRAVGTVRQQIKSILNKIGAGNQVQAATLAAAAAQAISHEHTPGDQLQQLEHNQLQTGKFHRQGRRIGWRRYGKRGGMPVVLMHGPFFGAGSYLKERSLAFSKGLDICCAERPGFGRTEAPPVSDELIPVTAADTLAMMDELNISSATFFCQENGLTPALELAVVAPDRVRAIVGISTSPPYKTLAQTHAMPSKQRLFVWAAQHARWMIRLLIRLGMVQLRKLGPERWLDAAFAEVEDDMRVIYSDGHRDGNMAAYAFNIQQNGLGYELDLHMSAASWDHLIEQVSCPVYLVHGRNNQTTPAHFMPAFQELNPAIHLRWIDDAGQTLLLSHTDFVYDYVARIAEHAGSRKTITPD